MSLLGYHSCFHSPRRGAWGLEMQSALSPPDANYQRSNSLYCLSLLTVFVAGLSERFAFREDNGHSQVLERWDVEERGVLIVPDILVVQRKRGVEAVRQNRAAHVAGAKQKKKTELDWNCHSLYRYASSTVVKGALCRNLLYSGKTNKTHQSKLKNNGVKIVSGFVIFSSFSHLIGFPADGYSRRLRCPLLVPALLPHQQEGQQLKEQAGEDLSEDGEEQRAGDQAGGGSPPHQLLPGWVQTHWDMSTHSTPRQYEP